MNDSSTKSRTLAALLAFTDPEEVRKRAIWEKALPTGRHDPALYRWDFEGNLICYADHGTCKEYGWEIDHATPSALGGSDHYANLRPRHWRSNRVHGGLLAALLKK